MRNEKTELTKISGH